MDDDIRLDPNSSVVYIALSILCSSQNSLIPEILYLFSPRQIIDFIKVFGGETIKVPTSEEFSRDLLAGLACYHVHVEGRSWDWFELKYHVDGNVIRALNNKINNWMSGLSQSEISFIKSLKLQEKAKKLHDEIKI